MIATRGGLAPPEAPLVIEHREALYYMLCEAAELEHGIMCQYLYAAFSLKQSEDEGLSAEEAEAVQRWRKHVSHIATQEMLHLSLVQNLLAAIGGAPHMSRPNFPHPAAHYPAGVHLALLPFGEPALQHFMFLERPEGMDLDDAEGMAAYGRAVPAMTEGEIVPRSQDFKTVGHLYRSIEAGFAHLAGKFGERRLFVGPPRAQATQQYFGWPELVAVTGTATAQKAIDEILEQGEGPRGNWRDAHFGQFVQIMDEYTQLREANPAFQPARPVVTVNVRPSEHDTGVPLVTDPLTRQVMDLFNVSYEVLLLMLQRFFAHTEETDAQLKALADAAVNLMFQAIKPIGDLVTTLPAGPDYPARTAGPSFELFYESDTMLPHREAAWILVTERIRQAAEFCEPGGPCTPGVADALAEVRSSLTEIARSLEAHLPARDLPPEPPAPAEPIAGLLGRAADFYRTGRSFTGQDHDLLSSLGDLICSVYPVVQASQADARTLARLVNSVLRPLAEALPAPAPAPAAPSAQPGAPAAWPSRFPLGRRPARDPAAGPVRSVRPARPARSDCRAAGPGLPRGAGVRTRQSARRPGRSAERPAAGHRDRQERPVPGHERRGRPHPARRAADPAAAARAVPVRRLGDEAVLRRGARDQRVHRRQGSQAGTRPARHVPGGAGHDLRQPGHLPALGAVQRPAPHRVPDQPGALRRPERRPDGRTRPGRPRLPVRGAEPGLRHRGGP